MQWLKDELKHFRFVFFWFEKFIIELKKLKQNLWICVIFLDVKCRNVISCKQIIATLCTINHGCHMPFQPQMENTTNVLDMRLKITPHSEWNNAIRQCLIIQRKLNVQSIFMLRTKKMFKQRFAKMILFTLLYSTFWTFSFHFLSFFPLCFDSKLFCINNTCSRLLKPKTLAQSI